MAHVAPVGCYESCSRWPHSRVPRAWCARVCPSDSNAAGVPWPVSPPHGNHGSFACIGLRRGPSCRQVCAVNRAHGHQGAPPRCFRPGLAPLMCTSGASGMDASTCARRRHYATHGHWRPEVSSSIKVRVHEGFGDFHYALSKWLVPSFSLLIDATNRIDLGLILRKIT